MSSLDKSLDDIIQEKPKQNRRARPAKAKTANGVKKATSTKLAKSTAAGKVQSKALISSKIIVHGLPTDVTERQIREYMTAEVGPVVKCDLAYNSSGVSKGSATITFKQNAGQNYPAKACSLLNGRSVDSTGPKPLKMRVEIIQEVPQPGLADRLGGLPKSVQQAVARGQKKGGNAATPSAKGDAKSKKTKKAPGRIQRVAKTAEELDAEMADYHAQK